MRNWLRQERTTPGDRLILVMVERRSVTLADTPPQSNLIYPRLVAVCRFHCKSCMAAVRLERRGLVGTCRCPTFNREGHLLTAGRVIGGMSLRSRGSAHS